jgi:integrase
MATISESKKRRRGRHEGSIFQRADGRWSAQLSLGFDGSGKRIRRTVSGETKKAVQDELDRLKNENREGTLLDPCKWTMGELLERWLEDDVRTRHRLTTLRRSRGVVKSHLRPHLGAVPLTKLKPSHIVGMLSSMERAGHSAATRQTAVNKLRAALRVAVDWNLIPKNPCGRALSPRASTGEIQTLDAGQVGKLLKQTEGDRLHALYVVAVTTGLRWGELCGLKWSDLDLKAGTLSVQRIIGENSGTLYVGEPKTAKSKRLVELPAMAVDALHAHRRRMLVEGHAGKEWVFVGSRGNWLCRRHVHRESFKPALKAAGLPAVKFHALRHSAATMMLAAGVHPKVVSERLGHANIGITLDVYSHVLPGMQREAAAKLDALLKAASA